MLKLLLETVRTLPNRDYQQLIKRNKVETLQLNTIINEKLTGKVQQQIWTSRRISKLEDLLIKVIQPKEWKGKGIKRYEQGIGMKTSVGHYQAQQYMCNRNPKKREGCK